MRSPFRSILTSALTACTNYGATKRSLSSMVSLQEISIPAADGTVLAAQRWTKLQTTATDENGEKEEGRESSITSTTHFDRTILCTHGWLDNCGTHHCLAPRLALELEAEVIAMDFPGHGWSSHRSKDAPPLVQADLVYYVVEAIQALQSEPSATPEEGCEDLAKHKWTTESKAKENPSQKKISLLGHSLGAGIASLTAASFPELIDQVVLLDAATFLAREPKDTSEHVRNHILRRQQHVIKEPRVYPHLERAIQVRQFSATKMPGNQSLSYEAAREIVLRGTRRAESQKDEEKKDKSSTRDGDSRPVQFRHDPRFTWPSIQYMTWDQNEGILAALGKTNIDVCVLQAEDGWPVDEYKIKRVQELLQPKVFQKMGGNHYFHTNPETAEAVGNAVIDFLKK